MPHAVELSTPSISASNATSARLRPPPPRSRRLCPGTPATGSSWKVLSPPCDQAHGRSLDIEVGLRNLQPCLAPELSARVVDLYLEDLSVDLRSRARLPYAHDAEYLTHVDGCARCPHRTACGGVYRGELAHVDGALFRWGG